MAHSIFSVAGKVKSFGELDRLQHISSRGPSAAIARATRRWIRGATRWETCARA